MLVHRYFLSYQPFLGAMVGAGVVAFYKVDKDKQLTDKMAIWYDWWSTVTKTTQVGGCSRVGLVNEKQ